MNPCEEPYKGGACSSAYRASPSLEGAAGTVTDSHSPDHHTTPQAEHSDETTWLNTE